jgi:hypothetical protein
MAKATENIASVSAFHNHSAGDLADQFGTLKAEIADLEAHQKAVRDELIRRGGSEVEGALFRVIVSDAVRWTLDAKTVRAEMGEDWWIARCRNAMVTTVAVKPLAVATKLAA